MIDWVSQEKVVDESIQGSDAWLKARQSGIGSSDIAVIMGVSKWGSLYNLWLDKTGQLPEEKRFKGNWATQRGHDLEGPARAIYEQRMNHFFPPAVMVHPEHTFVRASFDGIKHQIRRVLEIKCPGREAHEMAKKGMVPPYYWPQCQWLLMVSNYSDLDYLSWDGETDPVIVEVKADPAYQAEMLAKAREFWNLVETKTPPETAEMQIEDQELIDLLINRDRLKEKIDALTAELDAMTDQVKAKVSETAECGDFKITWSEVKGSIDYAKIPELKNIDLEPFRKKPTKRFQITKKKLDS